jgi:hypothetical protein
MPGSWPRTSVASTMPTAAATSADDTGIIASTRSLMARAKAASMSSTRRTSRRLSERARERAAYGTVIVVPSPVAVTENVPAAAFGV